MRIQPGSRHLVQQDLAGSEVRVVIAMTETRTGARRYP